MRHFELFWNTMFHAKMRHFLLTFKQWVPSKNETFSLIFKHCDKSAETKHFLWSMGKWDLFIVILKHCDIYKKWDFYNWFSNTMNLTETGYSLRTQKCLFIRYARFRKLEEGKSWELLLLIKGVMTLMVLLLYRLSIHLVPAFKTLIAISTMAIPYLDSSF